MAADRQRLLNLVASLEKENASLKESMGSEDLKKMAEERSTLIKENDNLMGLLEEQHQLLNEQVTAVADLQGKLDTHGPGVLDHGKGGERGCGGRG